MEKLLNLLTLNRVRFHALSLRGRVLLSQIPLSATMLLLFLWIALTDAALFDDSRLRASVVLTVALFAACVVVPWERLPYPSFLAVPLLDFVPIGLLRESAADTVTGLGLLAAFPVIWLAASGQLPRFSIFASALATLGVVWVPLFIGDARVTLESLTQPLLLPFMMFAIAVTVSVMTSSMTEQQRVVESKDVELRALLDDTARRERLLNAIVNAVGVGVLAIGEDGRRLMMNSTQQALHEYGMPRGVLDAREDDLLLFGEGGTVPLAAEERPERRAAAGETFSDYLVWIGEPGNQRVLSTSARTIRDADGRMEGSVIAYSDVTEFVAALAAKDDFVSHVSHELRTPLTSIHGYAELIGMSENLPSEVEWGLEVITRNSTQLLGLVSDLLGAASGATEIRVAPNDLAALVRSAVNAGLPRAAAAGIALQADTPESLPVSCDAARMTQVLDNLISNAIKYSPQGGAVTVHAGATDDGVMFSVTDTGMGMSDQDARDVFTRFFRSSEARRSVIPGLGLGLALAKDIVERHGGSLTCRSVLGEGSVFTCTLPATESAREVAEAR
ncbi:sensor histidine kinase [Planctomonas psychrotolerans]|uniref:sensor histidine kinase n=1 Tax=Planctomonas psychrotolerans TaxID=2528712 RepID=UPI001D0D3475|nr:ATP-binding protein [Planctomonas psychrotolerans]